MAHGDNEQIYATGEKKTTTVWARSDGQSTSWLFYFHFETVAAKSEKHPFPVRLLEIDSNLELGVKDQKKEKWKKECRVAKVFTHFHS